jgi:dihydrodipicolinate reductase
MTFTDKEKKALTDKGFVIKNNVLAVNETIDFKVEVEKQATDNFDVYVDYTNPEDLIRANNNRSEFGIDYYDMIRFIAMYV